MLLLLLRRLLLLGTITGLPGVLHLLLSLLLLILSSLPGRLRVEHPAKILYRPRSAEGGRPGEVAVKIDELGEVVHGKTLFGDCPVHVRDECGLPGFDCCRSSLCSFPLLQHASFTGDDASKPVRLIVGAVIVQCSRYVLRPWVARPSEVLLGRLPLLLRGRRELRVLRLRWR